MSADGTDLRVLVLAPAGRDGALASRVLEDAGVRATPCTNLQELQEELMRGAGAILLTEEALHPAAIEEIAEIFSCQRAWSDLPILVFSAGESGSEALTFATRRLAALANVTLLDRPTRKVTLVSAVRSALRARRRQYEVRDLLVQLERGVRDRDQFLAMLGHELRNPLSAILATVQIMEQQDPKTFARERALIHRQTRLLSRLVDDLLDVSRVTSGKIVLDRVPVNLRELVERCVQGHAAVAATRRIDLALAAGDAILTDGDPIRLEQVVNNLLTNAVKYTPEGGRVAVSVVRDGQEAAVRVQDNGVGIDAEVLPRVFDLFTQADHALDRSQGGLGIGLTLARSLVELHGGTVRAKSPGRGEGSTFEIRLPIGRTDPAKTAPSRGEVPRLRPRTILLIEDNPDVRDGLRCLLEEAGHDVVTAADGVEGIEAALVRRPEVALVDIGLPRLDGYGVGRRLRETLGRGVFLVALTGYGLPEDRKRALEAGYDAHLTKPVTIGAILDLLARAEVPPEPRRIAGRAGRGAR